jgi:hypothetical protein
VTYAKRRHRVELRHRNGARKVSLGNVQQLGDEGEGKQDEERDVVDSAKALMPMNATQEGVVANSSGRVMV